MAQPPSLTETIIYDSAQHSHLLPSIVALHAACITIDGTIATFIPPLSPPKMMDWWKARTGDPLRTTILQLVMTAEVSSDAEDLSGKGKAGADGGWIVVGVVVLVDGRTETGPFRGLVEKLLVSPHHRKMGIARRLMDRLDAEARKTGLTLLCLDTVTGTPAEEVYPRLGWTFVGIIPNYGIHPLDGKKKGATLFYKDLLLTEQL